MEDMKQVMTILKGKVAEIQAILDQCEDMHEEEGGEEYGMPIKKMRLASKIEKRY